MKVLILSYQTPVMMAGGAQQVAYDQFITLLRCGIDARIVSSIEDVQARHNLGTAYGKVTPLMGREREFLFLPAMYGIESLDVDRPELNNDLIEFVAAFNPDVVHFHHYHRFGLTLIERVRQACKRSLMCLTFHEMLAICLADGQLRRRSDQKICRNFSGTDCEGCFPTKSFKFFENRKTAFLKTSELFDCFLFPSQYLMHIYERWGISSEKSFVIPNGEPKIVCRNFSDRHSVGVNRFGYFGQLLESKGVHIVLDAIKAALQNEVFTFDINASVPEFANQDYAKSISRRCEEIGATGSTLPPIRFRGAYRRDDITDRMRDVDWVIIPSLWPETFALVLSEAWAHGRPAIVSDLGALDDRVHNGENGLKFLNSSSADLGRVMQEAIGNAPLWRRLNANIPPQDSDYDMTRRLLSLWSRMLSR